MDCCMVSDDCRDCHAVARATGQDSLADAIEHMATVLASLEASITANLSAGATCISDCKSLVGGSIACNCDVAVSAVSTVTDKIINQLTALLGSAFSYAAQAGAFPAVPAGPSPPPTFAPTIEVTAPVTVVPIEIPTYVPPSMGPPATAQSLSQSWAEIAAAVASGQCGLSVAAAQALAQVAATLSVCPEGGSIGSTAAATGCGAYLSQSQSMVVNVSLAAFAEALAAALTLALQRVLIQLNMLTPPAGGFGPAGELAKPDDAAPDQLVEIKRPWLFQVDGADEDLVRDVGTEESRF